MSEKNAPNPNADALRDIFERAGAIEDVGYTPAAAKAPQQVPSVGRIVHFVYGDKHVMAFITDPDYPVKSSVDDPDPYQGPYQALHVLLPMEPEPFVTVARNDEGGAPGTWHWPERV